MSQRKTLKMASHVELTIRRPDGNIEVVRHPKFAAINDQIFAQLVSATKAAGRGDILSYANITKDVEETDVVLAQRLAGEAADHAYDAYKAGHDAIARMSAGGEKGE